MEDDSPYEIGVVHKSGRLHVDEALLSDAVTRTLQLRGYARARIGVALVDDQHIAHLNEHYLNHEGPTDVLSFDLTDDWDQALEGELVISTDTAQREAATRGHDTVAEILLYAVHGTLHLTGMNDAEPEAAQDMHDLEDRILGDMGIGPVYERKQT